MALTSQRRTLRGTKRGTAWQGLCAACVRQALCLAFAGCLFQGGSGNRTARLSAHPGACKQCHLMDGTWERKAPYLELCATSQCHSVTDAESSFMHAPFAVRDCLVCHVPHASPLEHLLRSSEPRLCTWCHERLVTCPASQAEFLPPDPPCTSCHDSHGGEVRFFLREGLESGQSGQQASERRK